MSDRPVHWHEGMFLRPHHFQADRRQAALDVARAGRRRGRARAREATGLEAKLEALLADSEAKRPGEEARAARELGVRGETRREPRRIGERHRRDAITRSAERRRSCFTDSPSPTNLRT